MNLKWEYLVVVLFESEDPADETLNKLGALGWELVSVTGAMAYLKRPLVAALRSGRCNLSI